MSNLTETTDSGTHYDPERYDPQIGNQECIVCGTPFHGAGDGATVGQYCPSCELSVWIM